MKRALGVAAALSVITLVVYVMGKGFGTDPHEVPFLLTGKKAPDFTIKRLDNDSTVSFKDFAGRPMVINFWSTWCVPCKYEQPVLDWAATAYKDKAVFIGIVFEDTEQNTKRYLSTLGQQSFIQLFDPKSTVAVDYGVSGVPETYFINREGVIVGKYAAPFGDRREFAARIATILQ